MLDPSFQFTAAEVEGIISFLGYGRPEADVWFIGKEEGIAGNSDTDQFYNLRSRAKFSEVMDLREAHLQLHVDGEPIDILKVIPRTPVWRYQSKIMLAVSGEERCFDKGLYRSYLQERLGRRGNTGNTFMTELSPIPSKSQADKRWMSRLADCHPNLQGIMEARLLKLKALYLSNRPRLVICYSIPYKEKFARLLGIEWERLTQRTYAASDQRHILVPFLGNGRFGAANVRELQMMGILNLDSSGVRDD